MRPWLHFQVLVSPATLRGKVSVLSMLWLTSKSFLNLKAVSHSGVFWVYCFLKIRVYVLLTPEALVMVEAEEPKLFSTWCLWRTHICVSWKGFCFCSIHRLHGFFISNAFFNSASVFLTDNYMQLNLSYNGHCFIIKVYIVKIANLGQRLLSVCERTSLVKILQSCHF